MLAVEPGEHVGFREFVSTFMPEAAVPVTAGARLGPYEFEPLCGRERSASPQADRLWRAPRCGGPPEPLTPQRDEDDRFADISPDGRYLVITEATTLASDVWLLEPKG